MGKNIDQTIDIVFNEKTAIKPKNNAPTSIISSWDLHYKSWKNTKAPKLILRYEDLIENTIDSIESIILFICNILQINKEDLYNKKLNAFKTTDIEIFRRYELKFGFNESSKNTNFFGTAKKNTWKKILTEKQVRKIEEKFSTTMQEMGYI